MQAYLPAGNATLTLVAPSTALDILLVDDDEPLRDMLTRSFEREGHHVTAVPDGHAALRAAADRAYDVVLLDVALGRRAQRRVAVRHGGHVMALALEGAGEHVAQWLVVVDEQDVEGRGGRHGVSVAGPVPGRLRAVSGR